MRDPNEVHAPKDAWTLIKVLENGGEDGASYAVGMWYDQLVLACRWNGGSDGKDVGYPHREGRIPTWYVLDNCAARAIIKDRDWLDAMFPDEERNLEANVLIAAELYEK